MPDKKPKVIAFCGKGGVGKTSLAALWVKILTENPKHKVLAIDADPAIGLATSLGFRVEKSVDSIRNELIARLEKKSAGSAASIPGQLDYELLDAIEEQNNLAFLAIGRPEKEGCYCQVNSMLRDLIGDLSLNFDYVIIDGEAGIEQVNRRVMETVTHLCLVSDGSKKGINVANTIASVADNAIHYNSKMIIFNRIKEEELSLLVKNTELELLGWLPEDEQLRCFDMEGRSLLELKASSSLNAVRQWIGHFD
jgi:CO dehydrogenase maturation factor